MLQLPWWDSGAFLGGGWGQGQVQDHGVTWHMGGGVLADDVEELTGYTAMQGMNGGEYCVVRDD